MVNVEDPLNSASDTEVLLHRTYVVYSPAHLTISSGTPSRAGWHAR
jgi:hypothetical protein